MIKLSDKLYAGFVVCILAASALSTLHKEDELLLRDKRIKQLEAQIVFFRETCRGPQANGDRTTISLQSGVWECAVVKRGKRPERHYL